MNTACRMSAIIAAILVALAAAATAPAAGATSFHRCGKLQPSGAGVYKIRAHATACPNAGDVARHYWRTGDRHFNGWRCRSKQLGEELFHATCTRTKHGQSQIVKFEYGA